MDAIDTSDSVGPSDEKHSGSCCDERSRTILNDELDEADVPWLPEGR